MRVSSPANAAQMRRGERDEGEEEGGEEVRARATCLKETGVEEPEESEGNCTTAGV